MNRSTKEIIKQAAKNISFELLEIIKTMGALVPRPFETQGQYKWRTHMAAGGFSSEQISKGIYYLEKKNLVEKKIRNKRICYLLTIEGRHKLLMYRIKKKKSNPKDGTSCIITFDIPEKKRKHRDFLRRLLLKNGFMNLQRSVMIGPEFLPEEFFELLRDLKLRQNVSVIKGKILFS